MGEALAALGVSGTIAVSDDSIELRSGGAPIAIDIGLTVRQWPLLPPDMKRRKAAEIAQRLADSHHTAVAAGRARPVRRSATPTRFWIAIIGGISLLLLVGVVRMLLPRLRPEKVEARVPTEDDTARRERLARACDAMRDRLYKGASFGPFATEGWVVELWLARSKGSGPLKDSTAFSSVISGGKLTAAGDDDLAEVKDGAVELAEGFTEEMGNRSPAWNGVRLLFKEGYARAFLEQSTRQRFVMLADRLADASGAEVGALYARCAHLTTHDIGAWFRGPDAPGAVAAMVYQIGFFAEGNMLDRGALAALRTPGDLDALRKAASGPEGETLPRIVAAQGGTVNTAHGTSLVFPLSAPMRSLAATRAIARKMGVGIGTD